MNKIFITVTLMLIGLTGCVGTTRKIETGYINSSLRLLSPMRGTVDKTMANIAMTNLTSSDATVKEVVINLFDARHISQVYLVRSDIVPSFGASNTHFPCKITKHYDQGKDDYACLADALVAPGKTIGLNIVGNIAAGYPAGPITIGIVKASIVDNNHKAIPYFQPIEASTIVQ